MTPKEKAEQLVDNMLQSLYDNGSLSFKRILYAKAKECALIAVEELIYETRTKYWYDVKHEIELL